MKNSIRKIGIVSSLFLLITMGYYYVQLIGFLHGVSGCGCSSTCRVFYPTGWSMFIGYSLLAFSTILIWASLWHIKGLSKLWSIPAAIVWVISFYGNGFMLMNNGACGLSINQITWLFNKQKIGDYAKADAETIHPDSLSLGRYKGKLLGYAFSGNELKLYRVGEDPIILKTGFLFWNIRQSAILNDISYGLNVFRVMNAEAVNGHYEFIGGKGMSEKDFLNEFILTQKDMLKSKVINRQIVNEADGTTRFILDLK